MPDPPPPQTFCFARATLPHQRAHLSPLRLQTTTPTLWLLDAEFTRWFICIYAGSMTSQAVVTRIWDLFMWYGRRGPAVLVWVALGILYGCRRRMFESKSLPATVKAVRRHAEGCKTFDDLIRQAPVGLNQVRGRTGRDLYVNVCGCCWGSAFAGHRRLAAVGANVFSVPFSLA